MTIRIVVADDDPDLAEIFAQILEGDGYEVECAANGVQAPAALACPR